jgi:hypothetical protein
MNRIQFFVLTGLSSLVVLLLIGHIVLVRQVGIDQTILNQAQQRVNQGQTFQSNLKQLAVRIFQDSQKAGGDQGLKDLLTRQQISYNPSPAGTNGGEQSIPPAASSNH